MTAQATTRARRGGDEFELLRNVTVGQYIPTNSIVHRLDPRAKIVAAVFIILSLSFTRSFLATALLLGLVLLVARISRIPIRYVSRGIILGLPILILIFVLQLIFQGWVEPSGQVYFEFGWIRVTRFSLQWIGVGAPRRAEELVLAMESRCYMGADQRTKLVVLKSSPRDWLVALAALVLFVLVVYVIQWPPSHTFLPGL